MSDHRCPYCKARYSCGNPDCGSSYETCCNLPDCLQKYSNKFHQEGPNKQFIRHVYEEYIKSERNIAIRNLFKELLNEYKEDTEEEFGENSFTEGNGFLVRLDAILTGKEPCDRETGCGGISCKSCDDVNHKSIEEEIDEILNGIDKEEVEDKDGWWETSTGAEFGAKKLKEIKELFSRSMGDSK